MVSRAATAEASQRWAARRAKAIMAVRTLVALSGLTPAAYRARSRQNASASASIAASRV